MNELQFSRWKQLSTGLARSYKTLTPRRMKKLLAEIEECIERIVSCGLDTVADWDQSVQHGPGFHDHYQSASASANDYLWDNRYKFERYINGEPEVIRGRFGDMLLACVRAGFDVAVSPSAGVVGFTVGDLRDIFDGTIPDWIADHFSEPAALRSAPATDGVWLYRKNAKIQFFNTEKAGSARFFVFSTGFKLTYPCHGCKICRF